MIRIVLAGEPRGKGRPRFSRKTGRTYTPEQTRTYEAQLAWAAQVQMAGRPPLIGPLAVTIIARKSVPASFSKKQKAAAAAGALRPTVKPDFDNFAKCVDALNKIVWNDDAQVVEARVRKFYSEKPEMEICVSPLDESDVFL